MTETKGAPEPAGLTQRRGKPAGRARRHITAGAAQGVLERHLGLEDGPGDPHFADERQGELWAAVHATMAVFLRPGLDAVGTGGDPEVVRAALETVLAAVSPLRRGAEQAHAEELAGVLAELETAAERAHSLPEGLDEVHAQIEALRTLLEGPSEQRRDERAAAELATLVREVEHLRQTRRELMARLSEEERRRRELEIEAGAREVAVLEELAEVGRMENELAAVDAERQRLEGEHRRLRAELARHRGAIAAVTTTFGALLTVVDELAQTCAASWQSVSRAR